MLLVVLATVGGIGDWECGYCGNLNLASRKQTEKCNMRKCGEAHYLNSGKTYSVMTPQQAAALAAAEEAKKNQPKVPKRQSLYAQQGGGMANPKKPKLVDNRK